MAILERLDLKGRVEVQWILQTGREDFDWAQGEVVRDQLPAKVMPFLRRIHQAYAAADLVVCRSGAMTLAEIACCGTPSIRYFTCTASSPVSIWMSLARFWMAVKIVVSTSRMTGLWSAVSLSTVS